MKSLITLALTFTILTACNQKDEEDTGAVETTEDTSVEETEDTAVEETEDTGSEEDTGAEDTGSEEGEQ